MAKSKSMCIGCNDNYYNHSEKNGCWAYEKATIEKKIQVGLNERPPYSKSRARKVLSCYRVKGYAQININKTDYQLTK